MKRPLKKDETYYKQIVKMLRHGYIDQDTGRRVGKLATGFEAADGYDLRKAHEFTRAQKAKLTKYYNQITRYVSRPHYIYRARNKKRLKALQKAAQHVTGFPNIKVAFIPVATPEKPKIKFTKKGPIIIDGYITRRPIYIDKKILIRDGARAATIAARESGAKLFRVMAGEFEVFKDPLVDEELIGERVDNLQSKYDDPDSHDYYGRWMTGIMAYDINPEYKRKIKYPFERIGQWDTKRANRKEKEKKRRKRLTPLQQQKMELEFKRKMAKFKVD